jgi:hypothetical protein
MVKPCTRGKVEYKKPVNFNDVSNHNIEVHVVMYQDEGPYFSYTPGKNRIFMASSVIIGIEMTYTEDGYYVLNMDDKNELESFILAENNKKQKQREKTRATKPAATSSIQNTDGSVVIEVEPEQNTSSNRRSGRRRKCIIYDD